MFCPACDTEMVKVPNHDDVWRCPYCKFGAMLEDGDLTIVNCYDATYHTPVIRGEKKHVSADIGEFITSRMETGTRYKILIRAVKVK